MHVSVTGRRGSGAKHHRTWTLCAPRAMGPSCRRSLLQPLVRRLQAGDASLIGAQPCVGLLTLAEFACECEACTSRWERPLMAEPSMYERALGADLSSCPRPSSDSIDCKARGPWTGEVETEALTTWLARCLAWGLGTPRRATRGAIRFELLASPTVGTWRRHFPPSPCNRRCGCGAASCRSRSACHACAFAWRQAPQGLEMLLVNCASLGLPCPRWLRPRIVAREQGEASACL